MAVLLSVLERRKLTPRGVKTLLKVKGLTKGKAGVSEGGDGV